MSHAPSSALAAIVLKHSRGRYEIHFAPRLIELLSPLRKSLGGLEQFSLIVDSTVAELYPAPMAALRQEFKCPHPPLLLGTGEEQKSLAGLENICAVLSQQGLSRQSCLVAVGGGVTTDLVGFAAATYMRGIAYIQVPTSLLAQVDASIGGKTGVNLPQGKNLVGAFHQPQAVLISQEFLQQLPPIELACGFAEIIKHALLADLEFFQFLEEQLLSRNPNSSLAELPHLAQIIHRACEIKAELVTQDEFEQSGKRAWLNLGHTFAHALETGYDYQALRHGEAVALGMVLASRISCQLGHLTRQDCARLTALLAAVGLPHRPADFINTNNLDTIVQLLTRDKKKHSGGTPLVLLSRLGQAYLSEPYLAPELTAKLSQALKD